MLTADAFVGCKDMQEWCGSVGDVERDCKDMQEWCGSVGDVER